jgi:hypothetical protein
MLTDNNRSHSPSITSHFSLSVHRGGTILGFEGGDKGSHKVILKKLKF